MDVKGGYLHSMLEEEIYMCQPDRFDDRSGQVLKLQWALYGLKQSGRTWHQHLCRLLLGLGFQQSLANECIYIRQDKDSIEVISVYVDNFGLFTDSKGGMIKLKGELNKNFQMTELGEMKKILGIRIERDRKQGTLTMSQGHYIDVILARFNMSDMHPVSTPLHKMIMLNSSLDLMGPTTEVPYAKAISSLMYVALSTQPNLAFAIQHLSQFIMSYGVEHWTAIKNVLRYLKGSCDSRITFTWDVGLNLEIFVDSNYANRMDALSMNGYVAILEGGAIAWSSKKQWMIVLSTTEAKYMALTEGAKQLIWLRRFIWELSIDQSQPTSLHSDNLGAITLSQDMTYHTCTKHINVAYHFICEKVASHEAVLTYVPMKDNIADILMKGLELHQHHYLMGKLGFGIRNFLLRGSVGNNINNHYQSLTAKPAST